MGRGRTTNRAAYRRYSLSQSKRRISGPYGTADVTRAQDTEGGGTMMMMQSMGRRCSRTRCIRGSPPRHRCAALAPHVCVSACVCMCERLRDRSWRFVSSWYTVPSMHRARARCTEPHRAASRRAASRHAGSTASVGEIARAHDAGWDTYNYRGDRAPFHTSHTVWSRHTADASLAAPCRRCALPPALRAPRAILSAYRVGRFGFHATPRSNGLRTAIPFPSVIEGGEDDYCRERCARSRARACIFSRAYIERKARLIGHSYTRIIQSIKSWLLKFCY